MAVAVAVTLLGPERWIAVPVRLSFPNWTPTLPCDCAAQMWPVAGVAPCPHVWGPKSPLPYRPADPARGQQGVGIHPSLSLTIKTYE